MSWITVTFFLLKFLPIFSGKATNSGRRESLDMEPTYTINAATDGQEALRGPLNAQKVCFFMHLKLITSLICGRICQLYFVKGTLGARSPSTMT